MLSAEAKLGGCEEPVDDQHVAVSAIIHQFSLTLRADHEQRGHLTLHDAGREFDIDLATIVIGGKRSPRWAIPFDRIARNTLRRIRKNGSQSDCT
ncbi:hypothetical protein HY68_37350 [Streptomyces sp. AcH 505]|nr:hypothetical protein HY68_37350 [Streptomyces sp. AcH 505]